MSTLNAVQILKDRVSKLEQDSKLLQCTLDLLMKQNFDIDICRYYQQAQEAIDQEEEREVIRDGIRAKYHPDQPSSY